MVERASNKRVSIEVEQPVSWWASAARARLSQALSLCDRKILVICYSGIGDAIICGPILQSLNRLYPGRILFPETPVLKLFRDLEVADLQNIGSIGTRLRRLMDFEADELIEILEEQKIDVIFNLRRDRVSTQEKYESIAETLRARGILLTDICESATLETQLLLHTFDLSQTYFRQLGIELGQSRAGWLRESSPVLSSVEPAVNGLGFFLGAGNRTKRMPAAFWHRLISQVHAQAPDEPLSLIYGASEEETDDGLRVSESLRREGIEHRVVSGLTLAELTRLISTFQLIISCDTFMVHLAEALGVKVVGVYCSTNAQVYGPRGRQSAHVMSSYYARCPMRNSIGNCDGWDLGCAEHPCKSYVSHELVTAQVFALLHRPHVL